MASRRSTSKRGALSESPYKSRLEERIAEQLEQADVPFAYEDHSLTYTIPARKARYTPDFFVGDMVIEAKGYFRGGASDRQKLILIKETYPDLDIRLVFQRADNPIYRGSPTTYAKWAEDHGFKWADHGRIPDEWLKEVKHEGSPRLSSGSPRPDAPRKAGLDQPHGSDHHLRDHPSRRPRP